MIDAIILDTETTGFEEPEVIELAWKEPNSNGSFRKLYKPTKGIEWGAVATHHILMTDLLDCEPTSGAALDVPPARFIIGHNVDYDCGVLASPDSRRICTLAMSRSLWPEVDSHSLAAMTYFTQGANSATRIKVRGAHSALDDVLMCEALLHVIMDVTKVTDLESLWRFSEDARVPTIMTFGKFKGQPVSAVDRGYMNWYRRQPDTDPYVLIAFERNGM